MAARVTSPFSRTMNREQVTLTFKFDGAGDASPTNLRGVGAASVVYDGVAGRFVATLEDKWSAILSAKFTVLTPDNNNYYVVNLVDDSVSSVKTFAFQVCGAAYGDPPDRVSPVVGDTVCVELTLSNTIQVPNGN